MECQDKMAEIRGARGRLRFSAAGIEAHALEIEVPVRAIIMPKVITGSKTKATGNLRCHRRQAQEMKA